MCRMVCGLKPLWLPPAASVVYMEIGCVVVARDVHTGLPTYMTLTCILCIPRALTGVLVVMSGTDE